MSSIRSNSASTAPVGSRMNSKVKTGYSEFFLHFLQGFFSMKKGRNLWREESLRGRDEPAFVDAAFERIGRLDGEGDLTLKDRISEIDRGERSGDREGSRRESGSENGDSVQSAVGVPVIGVPVIGVPVIGSPTIGVPSDRGLERLSETENKDPRWVGSALSEGFPSVHASPSEPFRSTSRESREDRESREGREPQQSPAPQLSKTPHPPPPSSKRSGTPPASVPARVASASPADSSHNAYDSQDLQAVLEGRRVVKTYQMGEVRVQALRGVDFSLFEGELLVLLGASGSGKSTLLNILGGLDAATSGEVFYRGQPLDSHDDASLTSYRRRHVGFVFQFYNLVPSLTARENVQLVTELVDEPMSAAEALDLVGLGERMDHFPAQLSGGEQQRVAIARAVAKQPDVLLCDEPTGALDFKTGQVVLRVIDDVNRQLGTTTAVITHNAPIAAMANRVVTLADGRIVDERRQKERLRPEEIRW